MMRSLYRYREFFTSFTRREEEEGKGGTRDSGVSEGARKKVSPTVKGAAKHDSKRWKLTRCVQGDGHDSGAGSHVAEEVRPDCGVAQDGVVLKSNTLQGRRLRLEQRRETSGQPLQRHVLRNGDGK